MMNEYLDWLPTLAAALHFVQLPAMRVARRVLRWDDELIRLQPINGWILRVIGGGILLCIVGLGLLVLCLHGELLRTAPGIGLCLFLSVFWAYRGVVQVALYSKLWPEGERWSHQALCLLFGVLTSAYAASAIAAVCLS